MVKREKNSIVCIEIGPPEPQERNGRASDGSNVPRTNQIAPTQADGAVPIDEPPIATSFAGKLFKLLFFIHLFASAVLVAFLAIRGFFAKRQSFRLARYFVPLLSSVALAVLAALSWLPCTLRSPAKCLKHSLWISPLSVCFAGVLLVLRSTAASVAFGSFALALAATQSFYACWVTARLPYAYQILSVSVSNLKFSAAIAAHVALALTLAAGYSLLWTLGVGGLAASGSDRLAAAYLSWLLLSLAWTMQVIKNTVHVAVSRIAHARLVRSADVGASDAFRDAFERALGGICVGSAVAPIVGFVRGTARTMGLLAGGTDECMFSCVGCYRGVADRLVECANRWGFVHVGVYGKGFVKASEDTWGMFRQQRMESLIDLDLTGSFCFLCGTAGGAISALLGGAWMLAVDRGYATEVTVYAFVVGYFVMRIAVAWPQSCVSAYYVAYAEDPENPALGSPIRSRLRELERSTISSA